ncbi:variable surface lipoprotein [Mycoplasmopsis synoviae]|uniref:variable surface lipoprotein n=1 Tax=Mycoplasmopsis synoviae TaxID=2109 RepID=UPI0034DADB9C
MKLSKKFLLIGSALSAAAVPVIAISCGGQSESEQDKKVKALVAKMEADAKAVALKTTLKGYSKDSMIILSNKAEAKEGSELLIKAFNQFYGTNLSIVQVGGSENYQTTLKNRFAAGPGQILLVGAESQSAFGDINSNLVNTDAKTFLNITDTSKTFDDIVLGDKHFMPQSREAYGVIYNKKNFADAKITVFEGKSFSASPKTGLNLTKPEKYDGTVKMGDNLYVFAADLTVDGYKVIKAQLAEKLPTKQVFYSTIKAGKSDIWPITNHLLQAAIVSANLGTKGVGSPEYTELVAKMKDKTKTAEWLNEAVAKSLKDALDVYGYSDPKNSDQNKVVNSSSLIALGTVSMVQNGTWALSQISDTLEGEVKDLVGFLPVPTPNKTTEKLPLFAGASQRWAATTLANDEAKKKTVQLFLRFIYQTNSGVTNLGNLLGSLSPYSVSNLGEIKSNNELFDSVFNYGDESVDSWIQAHLVKNFNNDSEELVTLFNQGLPGTDAEVAKKLQDIYNRLLDQFVDRS